MLKRVLRKIFGIKEPKKPASATAKSRLQNVIKPTTRTTHAEGRRRDTGDDNDLLNPLNPVSPLSPINPLNMMNQMDEPVIRQTVEDDAIRRAGHHDHRPFMGANGGRQAAEPVQNYHHRPSYDDNHRHSHSFNDDNGRHSHSYGGGHSHSNHDSGSYDSGSGGGGGSD